ncbi:MAG: Rieske 2Fe-2S domain-containing protein [Gammaproteobacteria bacterium]|nr:Rieske 2Fe-2S domain-containing protein [Gammaproteobacteria bacterium]
MSAEAELDLERVVCRLSDLEEHGARGFTLGAGDWPLRGFVVRCGNEVRGYINRCPHAGHPLDLRPHRFLTPDRALILCSSHGALFEKDGGLCLAGPCAGERLRAVPLEVIGDVVLIAAKADLAGLAAEG